MNKPAFIGRKEELHQLQGLLKKRSASLFVLRGRRRIGKSRLLAEFGEDMKSYFFSGNPPDKSTTAQSERDEFSNQLARAGIPGVKADSWGNLFWYLSKATQKGRILIVLDEISWMGGKDPHFLGALKTAWDMYFSKNPRLLIAVCGSVSTWIEKNILSNTGFVGRITIDLVLEELPLNVCGAFWHKNSHRISSYEKFKFLAVTGGVPLYLEQLRQDLTAEQNIANLCFQKGGLLVREFDEVFSDLFSRAKDTHKQMLLGLADGPKSLVEICRKMKKEIGGIYSNHLDELIKSGFVKRDFTWDLKKGEEGKNSRYRLSDNYLRFYLKYIARHRKKIEKGNYAAPAFSKLPSWHAMMGLQFENLVIHNAKRLWELLQIDPVEIVMEGPYFQKTTTRQSGCQIDYLVQLRFNTLYVCEIKFSKEPVGKKILKEMDDKIKRFNPPKRFSIRPVLIHINGVDESVEDAQFFDKIINFSEFLA
ncbi:MAG: ATP-binding protein [Chlamydiales bacterium]